MADHSCLAFVEPSRFLPYCVVFLLLRIPHKNPGEELFMSIKFPNEMTAGLIKKRNIEPIYQGQARPTSM